MINIILFLLMFTRCQQEDLTIIDGTYHTNKGTKSTYLINNLEDENNSK